MDDMTTPRPSRAAQEAAKLVVKTDGQLKRTTPAWIVDIAEGRRVVPLREKAAR